MPEAAPPITGGVEFNDWRMIWRLLLLRKSGRLASQYAVLSLLFKLDDQIDMKFEADKDDEGNFKPSTVKLSFKNNLINK